MAGHKSLNHRKTASSRRFTTTMTCFQKTGILAAAVDLYIATGGSASSVAADVYGHPIGSWCVSELDDFSFVFSGQSDFNEDLSGWNTSRAITLRSIFQGASSFNQDLSSWDVSRVQDFRSAFEQTSAFNGSLSSWNTSSAVSMERMFSEAVAFDQDLGGWKTTKLQTARFLFDGATSFSGRGLDHWDVSSVTDMRGMLKDTASLSQAINVGAWSVGRVTDMAWMFAGSTSFRQDLCLWSRRIGTTLITTDMFRDTNCPYPTDPMINGNAISPERFCFECSHQGQHVATSPEVDSSGNGIIDTSSADSSERQQKSWIVVAVFLSLATFLVTLFGCFVCRGSSAKRGEKRCPSWRPNDFAGFDQSESVVEENGVL